VRAFLHGLRRRHTIAVKDGLDYESCLLCGHSPEEHELS